MATSNQDKASELARQAYEYGKNSAMTINEADKKLWAVVSNVPLLPQHFAYMCAIMNCILPGSGTILATCLSDKQSWSKT